jgi:hypothetical protein
VLNILLMAILVQEPAPTASPTAPPPVPAASPAAAAPVPPKKGPDRDGVKPAPTKGKREVIKGTFQGFDAERATVSFVDPDGRTQVWPVDKALAAASSIRAQELSDSLKTGMPVVIRYVRDSGQPVVVYIGPEGKRREGDKR